MKVSAMSCSKAAAEQNQAICRRCLPTLWRLMVIPRWVPFLAAFISLACLLCIDAASSIRAQTVSSSGLPLDANGWTIFTASSNTNIIYVSSSTGNDSTGVIGDVNHPYKTIAKGLSLLRNGYPDWLLLKQGDTWIESNQLPNGASGLSATQPQVIGSYDPAHPGIVDPSTGPRPLIETNAALGGAIYALGNGFGLQGGNNIAFVGLEFYAYDRDPSNPNFNSATVGTAVGGLGTLNHFSWVLVEDCRFRFFSENLGFDASLAFASHGFSSNLTIRRNVIVDAYTINANGGNGIHLAGINNVTIEENVIDHNGYQASLTAAGQYKFNHNIYVSAYLTEYDPTTISNPIVLRGNIIANDASGSQLRSGGTITDNLWVHNPYPYSIGFPTAFQSVISNEVYTDAAGNSGQTFEWGPATGAPPGTNYNAGTGLWTNNIMAHAARLAGEGGIGLSISSGYTANVTNNILYDWWTPLLENSGTTGGSGDTGNVQDATGSNSEGYPDPTRTVGSYAGTLGLATTTAGFLAAARQQSKANWNPALTADAVNSHIRAGFGIKPTTSVPPSVPTGLAATVISSSQINTSWFQSNPGTYPVAKYNVFRNGNHVGTVASTSYQDSGLTAGATYTYTVAAVDTAGNTSAQSSPVSATTPTLPTPPSVVINSPANGATIKGNGSVNIASRASDPNGIHSITIMGDGVILQTCTGTTSCSVTWQGKIVAKGTHVITATATDNFGLQASATVTVLALK
jgi:chitodextrinase